MKTKGKSHSHEKGKGQGGKSQPGQGKEKPSGGKMGRLEWLLLSLWQGEGS
jgi:hypothetical protein